MTEEQLQGGFVNVVVRVGDTVRRQPGERAGFVHELLRHFEAQEWLGALESPAQSAGWCASSTT